MNRIVTILSSSAGLAIALLALGCSQTPNPSAASSHAKLSAQTGADSATASPKPKTTAKTRAAEDEIDKLIEQLNGKDPASVRAPVDELAPDAANVLALIKKRRGDVALLESRDSDAPLLAIKLGSTEITDEDLEQLKGLSGVGRLDLRKTGITDAGLAHVKNLTDLRELDLSETAVTDAGLAHLKELRELKKLTLAGTKITDAGLDHLASLNRLQHLDVSDTRVSSTALARFAGPTGSTSGAVLARKPSSEPPAPEDLPALKGPEEGTPPKVKVPQYFNELDLTEKQKDKIRRIAAVIDPIIEDLREQLNDARRNPFGRTNEIFALPLMIKKRMNQRQKAMEDILTDEQRDKLRKLRETNDAPNGEKPKSKFRGSSEADEPTSDSEKVMEGLTQAEVDKAVKDYADWQPTAIKGYAKGKESRFNITWQSTKKMGRWFVYTDMSAEGFAKRKKEMEKEGFKVAVESRWDVDGEERFAAIWNQK